MLYEFDKEIHQEGFKIFCGVDEAGRGPLAGPVVAAAVILPDDVRIDGLNDSKKISEKKREKLFDEIKEKALSYSIGVATVEEIEEYNILKATFMAMKRAVDGLEIKPEIALIDGNMVPPLDIDGRAIVKGDAKSASISAASILAKVHRDRYMLEMAEKYPEYHFEKHKGYGTKLHTDLIKEHGVSPIHRPSFLRKILNGK